MNLCAWITAFASPRSPRRSLPNGRAQCAPRSSRGWRHDCPIDRQRSRRAPESPDSNKLPDVRSAQEIFIEVRRSKTLVGEISVGVRRSKTLVREISVRGTEIKNTCPGDLRRGTEIKNTCPGDLRRGTEIKNTCPGDLCRGTEIKNTCPGDLCRGTEIKSTCTWVYRQFDTVVLCFRHGLRHSRSTDSFRCPP